MQSYFPPDFFTRNRRTLRDLVHADTVIVITGNGSMQRGADEPSPFHQDSNFWYLTGISAPDLTLVITAEDSFIIVPTRSDSRTAFDGAHDIDGYKNISGITTYYGEQEGWNVVRSAMLRTQSVASLLSPPEHMKQYGIYSLPFRRRLLSKLKRLAPGVTIQDMRSELGRLRSVKQPAELTALQAAIDITSDTLQTLVESKTFIQATHEYQLEAELTYGFRMRGAEGHAFAPIVGAGQDGVTLHHIENNGPMENSDLIVLDVGASVSHYSADITRTVSRKPFTKRQAAIFTAVEAVQDYALSLIKPGMLIREYEQSIEIYMGEQLRALGLIDTLDRAHIRRYFPHATSHFLGLDTHDTGDYLQPLSPGMVITCEPGIYVPEEGIGVRIEDDILITESGYRDLSAACPRRLTPVQ